MAGYSEFSFTSLWARIGGSADQALKAAGNAPRGVVVALPEGERAALSAKITPHLDALDALRLQTLATVDSRARLLVPLAGGGAFVALIAGGQGAATALIVGLIAAVVGWFIAMGNRSGKYQAAVKNRFGTVTSAHLSGFDHVVEPETDLAELRDWRLFPDLQSARTSDRIKGQRDGRSLSLSEMSIAFAPGRRGGSDHVLSCSVVEVASSAVDGAILVLTPKEAPPRILEAQRKAADLLAASTGDAAFDAVYSLRASDPETARLLTTERRAAILALGDVAPAAHPYLVFLPGYLVVLFPTMFADLAFHVPPYWVRIDAEALLAQFASDLALKNSLINAVLHLPDQARTE
ncbi:MAG: hypothetical protein K0B00_14260 [Rhodobacteraceae bacterium]|nr:hypothetical protein [Paracoccaceae bacterium]